MKPMLTVDRKQDAISVTICDDQTLPPHLYSQGAYIEQYITSAIASVTAKFKFIQEGPVKGNSSGKGHVVIFLVRTVSAFGVSVLHVAFICHVLDWLPPGHRELGQTFWQSIDYLFLFLLKTCYRRTHIR